MNTELFKIRDIPWEWNPHTETFQAFTTLGFWEIYKSSNGPTTYVVQLKGQWHNASPKSWDEAKERAEEHLGVMLGDVLQPVENSEDLMDALECLIRAETRRESVSEEDDKWDEHIEMAISEALEKARVVLAKHRKGGSR